ncbi:MAG: hydroxymethylglutaryl-CoA lyase, partial [Phycisphaerales bacterium]|nr:hydroxymethylglutaryl-CoA lyase [Phycisphaerales bacterium]
MIPTRVRITDVGPRDGLQNESVVVPVAAKVALVNALARSGVAEVEVSSFVSPKWVPQLGDAAAVFDAVERVDGVVYSALVPNMTGMERALAVHAAGRLDKIAVFTAASESFSRRNTNATIAETLERFAPVVNAARGAGLAVRGYV